MRSLAVALALLALAPAASARTVERLPLRTGGLDSQPFLASDGRGTLALATDTARGVEVSVSRRGRRFGRSVLVGPGAAGERRPNAITAAVAPDGSILAVWSGWDGTRRADFERGVSACCIRVFAGGVTASGRVAAPRAISFADSDHNASLAAAGSGGRMAAVFMPGAWVTTGILGGAWSTARPLRSAARDDIPQALDFVDRARLRMSYISQPGGNAQPRLAEAFARFGRPFGPEWRLGSPLGGDQHGPVAIGARGEQALLTGAGLGVRRAGRPYRFRLIELPARTTSLSLGGGARGGALAALGSLRGYLRTFDASGRLGPWRAFKPGSGLSSRPRPLLLDRRPIAWMTSAHSGAGALWLARPGSGSWRALTVPTEQIGLVGTGVDARGRSVAVVRAGRALHAARWP